jgi:hypothetical protein
MSELHGPARHPLIGRQRHLVTALRVGALVAFAAALVGLLAPARVGDPAGRAFLVLLVALPLGRLVWLLVRWVRRRDLRFASVAALLLAVVAFAAASPWW